MGTFYPGMKINALDLSPNFAGTLMAIINGIGGTTGIISPVIVALLAPTVSYVLVLTNLSHCEKFAKPMTQNCLLFSKR